MQSVIAFWENPRNPRQEHTVQFGLGAATRVGPRADKGKAGNRVGESEPLAVGAAR